MSELRTNESLMGLREGELWRSDWLSPLRERALARFRETGLPTTRQEDWRFTDVAPVARTHFSATSAEVDIRAVAEAIVEGGGLESATGARYVSCYGSGAVNLSEGAPLPPGTWVGSLAEVAAREPGWVIAHLGRLVSGAEGGFSALNTAFLRDGIAVHVPAGAVVERPIHLIHFSAAGEDETPATHARTLIVVEPGAEVQIVEHHLGTPDARYLANAVTEVAVAADASLRHYRVTAESDEAFHVGLVRANVGRNARYGSYAIALSGGLVRTDIEMRLTGEGAEVDSDGIFLAHGREHVDHHTTLDHLVPHTTSRQLYRGILDDASRGVFGGKVIVRADAQKISADQRSDNLLLGDRASVHAKPELVIHADDVRCSHGATVGRLDQAALFYLRSRGIPEAKARAMLTAGFATEVFGRVSDEPLRHALEAMVAARLDKPGGSA